MLPPALPEQVALRGHRTRQRLHCQHRVIRALRLYHQLEQGHRPVS